MNNNDNNSRVNRFDNRTNGNHLNNGSASNAVNGESTPPPSRHRHPIRNTFFAILGVILIVGGAFGAKLYSNLKNSSNVMFDSVNGGKARNVSQVIKDGKPISILLMGTDVGALGRDSKAWGGGRTDSMMLVTVNPKKKTTTMISIPRDSLVAIPGHEENFPSKINAAYYYGQTKSAIATTEKMFNVPIDFYALLNMSGLEQVINKVGGVDIVPPLTFTYENQHFTKGKEIHVNGEQALKFTRMRYQDPESDYGRTLRQRIVISALLKKSANLSSLLNEDFLNSIASQSRTDFTFGDMITLANQYRPATKHVVSDHVQGVSDDIAGQSFEVLTQTEKQRVTNKVRHQLELGKSKTGKRFGGTVPASLIAYAPAADFGETPDTASTWGQDTNTASQYAKTHKGSDNNLDPNYGADNTDATKKTTGDTANATGSDANNTGGYTGYGY
ncbi:LCP family glycopolymer transferase [Furfurilactobacillus siliginis]|uniref:LytR family transcriptional regulator n=1 Tax=Furfurilactobacillus siliginis TaxID=348151 RepID=A0A0R2L6K3_9LACO|nr:LCP family protein [Furfurilactobacillus siliginis]KRN94228.1 transcription regulator [Furfurilactobacillus siliginis]GEK29256.1 LytR family transcriptional regulator [Furfurilactobacillus siliginis]